MFKKVLAGVMALVVAATIATTAVAANRNVQIVNNSWNTLIGFQASNIGEDTWSDDILPDYIGPGNSVWVNFNDGTGYCKFDFKATFTDGRRVWSVIKYGVNVCRISTFTYNP